MRPCTVARPVAFGLIKHKYRTRCSAKISRGRTFSLQIQNRPSSIRPWRESPWALQFARQADRFPRARRDGPHRRNDMHRRAQMRPLPQFRIKSMALISVQVLKAGPCTGVWQLDETPCAIKSTPSTICARCRLAVYAEVKADATVGPQLGAL